MAVTKGDHLVIKRNGELILPGELEFEELEIIDYPIDHPMRGVERALLLVVKRVAP